MFYKRWIAGVKTAGKPGYDPFPTVYDAIVCARESAAGARRMGWRSQEEIGWNYQIGRPGLVSVGVRTLMKALHFLSFGKLADDHVNLTYIIEKPAVAGAPAESSELSAGAEVAV